MLDRPQPGATTAAPRIGIVEDQTLVLNLLADLCRHRFHWNVVLTAKCAAEAAAQVPLAKPDVMLVDINLPDEDGITLSLSLKKSNPTMRIIVLSAECTEYTVLRVKQSGLDGYVDKNSDPDFIQDALLTVIRDGRTFFSPLVRDISKGTAKDTNSFQKVLSDREGELLPYFGMAYTDTQVADMKNISSETVRKHRENIMRKLNLRSVPQLVHYCIEKGFVLTRPGEGVRPAQWPPSSRS